MTSRNTFFTLILLSLNAHAQNESASQIHFDHLTGKNGLPSNSPHTMMQDKQGFIWIGTIDGLIRYDGVDFNIYRNDPGDSTSIPTGWVTSMMQDDSGIIWMGMEISDNLVALNPATGKFRTFHHRINDSTSLSVGSIGSICETKDGTIWVVSDNGVLNGLHPQNGRCNHFDLHIGANTSYNRYYSAFIKDKNEKFWIAMNGSGLLQFDPSTKKLISFAHDARNKNSLSDNNVNCLLQDHSGKIWIGTSTGLCFYDPDSKLLHSYSLLPSSAIPILCIYEDISSHLWLGTDGSGVLILNLTTHTVESCKHNDEDISSISSNLITFISADRSGQLWLIANDGFGFDIYSEAKKKFSAFQHQPQNASSLINNRIDFIYEDHENNFYIGTDGGMNTFDPVTGTCKLYQQIPALNKWFSSGITCYMFEDSHHNYWIAKEIGALYKINPREKKFQEFIHEEGNDEGLLNDYIWFMHEDANGMMWISGANGLQTYNPSTGKFTTYLKDYSNGIGVIYKDRNGMFWLTDYGMKLFDPEKKQLLKALHHHADDSSSISNDVDISIFPDANARVQDKQRIVWIGTMGGGLNAFDPTTEKFRAFTVNDGLPSNVVWTILSDEKGNLWLATNHGISRFTPPPNPFDKTQKGVFRNYDVSDGLPDNEFTFNVGCKADDGSMYMGTASHGFIHFHPDSLKDNPFVPPVFITGFSLFNKSVAPNDQSKILQQPIENTKEITLRYDQNVFSFTFAALSYVHPEKNQYAYKLDGFDKDWNYTDATKHFANYTNLNAGEYTFRVKGSNNDGVWNEEGTSIKLIITPPYWQTWWFRLLILVLISSMVYALYRFRLNQMMRLLTVRNKISSDLHDDLGSTLSSISIYTEIARKQSKEHLPVLDKIGESSRMMIESMSDIVWSINSENDTFENLVTRMRSYAHEMLSLKEIEYTFEADEKLNEMKLPMERRKNIFLIFKEAIHNLVKYSGATHVTISISSEDHHLRLLVRDDGNGFDKENVKKGNGMRNMKRRSDEINAELNVETEIGKGTRVELLLKTK